MASSRRGQWKNLTLRFRSTPYCRKFNAPGRACRCLPSAPPGSTGHRPQGHRRSYVPMPITRRHIALRRIRVNTTGKNLSSSSIDHASPRRSRTACALRNPVRCNGMPVADRRLRASIRSQKSIPNSAVSALPLDAGPPMNVHVIYSGSRFRACKADGRRPLQPGSLTIPPTFCSMCTH